MSTWTQDPWLERSEEFYRMVYAGGRCRYCGKAIVTAIDLCDCAEMNHARDRFQRAIRQPAPAGPPAPPAEAVRDNPDRNIEPAGQEFPL